MPTDFEYVETDRAPCFSSRPEIPEIEPDLYDWGISQLASPEQMESWYHNTHVVASADVSDNLQARFLRLREEWIRGTADCSILSQIVLHPAYQQIIAMGPSVIPLILQSLVDETDHWFWALKVLNRGNDVAEGSLTMREAAVSWIDWGRKGGYLE